MPEQAGHSPNPKITQAAPGTHGGEWTAAEIAALETLIHLRKVPPETLEAQFPGRTVEATRKRLSVLRRSRGIAASSSGKHPNPTITTTMLKKSDPGIDTQDYEDAWRHNAAASNAAFLAAIVRAAGQANSA